jgi:hypothetical protein
VNANVVNRVERSFPKKRMLCIRGNQSNKNQTAERESLCDVDGCCGGGDGGEFGENVRERVNGDSTTEPTEEDWFLVGN